MATNRNYKDSVFSLYLGEDKARLIEAYNALTGRDCPIDTPVIINTLEDALYLDRINDISFILDGKQIVLIEHQSTLNENMPLRLLIYISRLYEKILDSRSIYSRKLIKIPKPEFIVLYNGAEDFPDMGILKLTDAFMGAGVDAPLELEVKVHNINQGRNGAILERSKALNEYAAFIGMARAYEEAGMPRGEAIKAAVRDCIKNGVMKEFLKAHGSEVENMLFTEFNIDDAQAVWKEEGFEEGIEKGIEKGMEKGMERAAVYMIEDGVAFETISKRTGFSFDKIEALRKH